MGAISFHHQRSVNGFTPRNALLPLTTVGAECVVILYVAGHFFIKEFEAHLPLPPINQASLADVRNQSPARRPLALGGQIGFEIGQLICACPSAAPPQADSFVPNLESQKLDQSAFASAAVETEAE